MDSHKNWAVYYHPKHKRPYKINKQFINLDYL